VKGEGWRGIGGAEESLGKPVLAQVG